ncbi:protein IQ-DOMAIN 19-like [Gastrolobium bilobum]|uniref:protein IQ-DOMAIN 19-like n=1 Tax=Gastrolobium bilobum TaxID=150636 RepID=UPI002AB066A1|nr:protein IQ-DOMAIN 19-like [Gastrolobium bilobum]
MGKTGKWLRNFLTGKKDKEKEKEKCATNLSLLNGTDNPTTPISATQKEKRRWSFRRSSASATASKELNFAEPSVTASVTVQTATDAENDKRKHAMTVFNVTTTSIEEASAIRIQSVFRSYLARKALCALRGIVKLQALVRGRLVRKQATETLRCMQALVIAQARARAQKARMVSEGKHNQKQSPYRKTTEDNLFMNIYNEMDRGLEENTKIVEIDVCESDGNSRGRNNTANYGHCELSEHRFSTYYSSNGSYSKEENHKVSPAPSALTELSPRACSGHFEDCSFSTAQSTPHYYSDVSRVEDSKLPFAFPRPSYAESMSYDYPLFPNYMANTESSRAKVRSHSAPKQRPDSYERQPSRRRVSVGERNVPRPVRMQRSSSHVGVTTQNYQYPWSIKLDRSSVSLRDSECGSTSTVLTNSNYCGSLASYDVSTYHSHIDMLLPYS